VAKVEFYYGSPNSHMAVLDDGAVPRWGNSSTSARTAEGGETG
jgi:hypothetical protein